MNSFRIASSRCTACNTLQPSVNRSWSQVAFSTRPYSAATSINNGSLTSTRLVRRKTAVEQTSTRNQRTFLTMPGQETGQAVAAGGDKKAKKPPAGLRPSSSILLLSPTNQVLLLHRVKTSTSFASAHVFPGGNLSSFHEGPLPAADSPQLHQDGEAYRLAAIRETFEESGILLARKPGQSRDQGLLQIPDEVRDAGRKQIHGNKVKFPEWLKGMGGEPDVENLIPCTRWITPHGPPKRFTTQMYLYMLPLSTPSSLVHQNQETIIPTPTHDGGLEHTAATFEDASVWLDRAMSGDIILFPPQFFLLHLISAFIRPSPQPLTAAEYQAQRSALLEFLARVPTAQPAQTDKGNTHQIPWAEKVISPSALFMRQSDGRLVLALDKPGPELKGSGRGGDWERVVLVKFKKEGPRNVEVRKREEVLAEERAVEEKEREAAKL
ncbi:hypothetical protein VTI74DRAFT_5306 [Chaetomium olivicolor]